MVEEIQDFNLVKVGEDISNVFSSTEDLSAFWQANPSLISFSLILVVMIVLFLLGFIILFVFMKKLFSGKSFF